MAEPARVLVVANRTTTTPELLEAVRLRAADGPATFHLLVPNTQHGLHRIVDPEDADAGEAERALADGRQRLGEVTGTEVTGAIGVPEPLAAVQDAVNLSRFDEIMISTLPRRVSRWLRMDLVSKVRGLGLPVTHVEAAAEPARRTAAAN